MDERLIRELLLQGADIRTWGQVKHYPSPEDETTIVYRYRHKYGDVEYYHRNFPIYRYCSLEEAVSNIMKHWGYVHYIEPNEPTTQNWRWFETRT